MKRNISKEISTLLKGKELDYWLLTYVKDRLYYEFSGSSDDIPWDKIESELKDKIEDPLAYLPGKEDVIWTGYIVFKDSTWVHKKSIPDGEYVWSEGFGIPPNKEHNKEYSVYSI